jgi:hypothetical protein
MTKTEIEDATHLQVLDSLARELQQNLVDYNARANGGSDKATLLALRLEQNAALKEILRKQERHLRFMAGEKIEPEHHHVEAVLVGISGLEG